MSKTDEEQLAEAFRKADDAERAAMTDHPTTAVSQKALVEELRFLADSRQQMGFDRAGATMNAAADIIETHLRTPAPMLMTQEWLDKKVDADPVAEVEACTPASGEAGEMVERLRGPVQWGYMCLADGGFIKDDTPVDAADLITRLSATDTEAMRLLREALNRLPDRYKDDQRLIDEISGFLARIDALAKGGA